MIAENEKKVVEVVRQALNLESGALTLESSVNDIEAWDSLGHLEILSALDKSFDRKVASIREMALADSVVKIVEILKENSLI